MPLWVWEHFSSSAPGSFPGWSGSRARRYSSLRCSFCVTAFTCTTSCCAAATFPKPPSRRFRFSRGRKVRCRRVNLQQTRPRLRPRRKKPRSRSAKTESRKPVLRVGVEVRLHARGVLHCFCEEVDRFHKPVVRFGATEPDETRTGGAE